MIPRASLSTGCSHPGEPTAGHTGASCPSSSSPWRWPGSPSPGTPCGPLPRRGRGGPCWVPVLFTTELAPFHAALHLGLAGGFAAAGWAGGWAGAAGLGASGLSVAGLAIIQARAGRARRVVERAAAEVLGSPVRLPRLRSAAAACGPTRGCRGSVEVAAHLSYGPHPAHLADRYRRRGHCGPAPVLVQVHGGGWTGGRRGWQGRPLVHRMARDGWVVFDLEYRPEPAGHLPRPAGRPEAGHRLDPSRRPPSTAPTLPSSPSPEARPGATWRRWRRSPAATRPISRGSRRPTPRCRPASRCTGSTTCSAADGRPKWPYLATHVLKVTPEADPEAWRRGSPVRCARARAAALPGGPRRGRLAGAPGGLPPPGGGPAGRRRAGGGPRRTAGGHPRLRLHPLRPGGAVRRRGRPGPRRAVGASPRRTEPLGEGTPAGSQ